MNLILMWQNDIISRAAAKTEENEIANIHGMKKKGTKNEKKKKLW